MINTHKNLEEKQLIQGMVDQSEAAFKILVERYQDQVINTCLGFVPNHQDAEDLCQEVFIEVFRSISRFRQDAQLSTWIYRIAISKSLAFIRYKKRKRRQAFFQSLIGLEDQQAQSVSDEWNHPGVQLENKERAKVLYDKIEKLPENQRIAFTLHKVEHLSHKEMAEIMNVSISAIESLLHRAKNNLKKRLFEYYSKKMI